MSKGDNGLNEKGMKESNVNLFSIPILETVKIAQLQNGLRHRDFQRYRQYCARRLRRIRKSTKLLHGKGKQFIQTSKQLETFEDPRVLYLPLYHAERAWSYAMELKEQDHNEKMEQGEDANSRLKFHLHGRLRKAAEWSQRLMNMCSLRGDVRTSLEAEAYAAFMSGNYAFHREEHERALTFFLTARRIYSDLIPVGKPQLLEQLIAEVDPFIRFCQHRLSLEPMMMEWNEETTNTLLQSKIEIVLLEARKQKASQGMMIQWKQQSITIPTSELQIAWIRPEEIINQFEKIQEKEKKHETMFLSLLSAYDSILNLLKTRIQQQSKSSTMNDMDTLTILEEYIEYKKQTHQVERLIQVYKQLCSEKHQHGIGDYIHVLDMIIQSVEAILTISRLETLEPLIFTKYSAYRALFQSIRAATMAQSYVDQRQFSKAISLYQYATGFLQEAQHVLEQQPAATDDVLQGYLKTLSEELIGAQSRTTAQSFLYMSKQEESIRSKLDQLEISSKSHKTLLERQDEYTSGTAKGLYQLISIPPELQVIPCKPILFDMAFNTFEFPDLTERMKTEEEKEAEKELLKEGLKPTTNSRLFGWFRS